MLWILRIDVLFVPFFSHSHILGLLLTSTIYRLSLYILDSYFIYVFGNGASDKFDAAGGADSVGAPCACSGGGPPCGGA